jgi:hypothetical protein
VNVELERDTVLFEAAVRDGKVVILHGAAQILRMGGLGQQ